LTKKNTFRACLVKKPLQKRFYHNYGFFLSGGLHGEQETTIEHILKPASIIQSIVGFFLFSVSSSFIVVECSNCDNYGAAMGNSYCPIVVGPNSTVHIAYTDWNESTESQFT